MGWGNGCALMCEIIREFKSSGVDFESRKEIYAVLIDSFENFDCDTLQECVGEDAAYDAVYESLYPEEQEDES